MQRPQERCSEVYRAGQYVGDFASNGMRAGIMYAGLPCGAAGCELHFVWINR